MLWVGRIVVLVIAIAALLIASNPGSGTIMSLVENACEITVTDAEYAYYALPDGAKTGDSYDIPYYIYTIPDGVYVGRGKRKKQYNSYCYIHSDGYSEHEE